jgi:hypothetical protein
LPRTSRGNEGPLIWINADQAAKAHVRGAQGEVTSGRAALTEPFQLLGTCAVPVSAALHNETMVTFLYRCPKTCLRVQGWVADEWGRPEQQNYEAVNCLARGGVHLVNPVSGKTIGEDDKAPN